MDFGMNIKEIKDIGSKMPNSGGFIGRIFNVECVLSKENKKPMMVLFLDIDEGEFKGFFKGGLRLSQTYDTDLGKGIIKGIIKTAQEANPANITGADFTPTGFNEKKLIGCQVGIVTKWTKSKNDGKYYLNAEYITSKDKALSVTGTPRPEAEAVNSVVAPGSDGMPF